MCFFILIAAFFTGKPYIRKTPRIMNMKERQDLILGYITSWIMNSTQLDKVARPKDSICVRLADHFSVFGNVIKIVYSIIDIAVESLFPLRFLSRLLDSFLLESWTYWMHYFVQKSTAVWPNPFQKEYNYCSKHRLVWVVNHSCNWQRLLKNHSPLAYYGFGLFILKRKWL